MTNKCLNDSGTAVLPEPLLFDAALLARLTSRSVRSIWRDLAAGRLPRPIRLGGSVRWRRSDVESWIAADCPSCEVWEGQQNGK